MSNHVYKTIELTGSSTASSDEAVRSALAKAAKTIRGMRWFQVLECRGHIERDKIDHWQVTIKVGFTLED
jgi:dodecin